MAEYIDREALDHAFMMLGYADTDMPRRMLARMPAKDVAPVVHGRWYDINSAVFKPHCSICLEDSPKRGYTPNYCPNCGAKMDGGENIG